MRGKEEGRGMRCDVQFQSEIRSQVLRNSDCFMSYNTNVEYLVLDTVSLRSDKLSLAGHNSRSTIGYQNWYCRD